jgi:hypothetical protein
VPRNCKFAPNIIVMPEKKPVLVGLSGRLQLSVENSGMIIERKLQCSHGNLTQCYFLAINYLYTTKVIHWNFSDECTAKLEGSLINIFVRRSKVQCLKVTAIQILQVLKQLLGCFVLSFVWFSGVWILCDDVSEYSACSVYIGRASKKKSRIIAPLYDRQTEGIDFLPKQNLLNCWVF